MLRLGVIATSAKPDERRLAIHPEHVGRLEPELRAHVTLERGYGVPFGIADAELAALGCTLAEREDVVRDADVVLLPKPLAADVAALRPGQVLWGWPHCVQDVELTQAAIDREVTVIAWEAMNRWTEDGRFAEHVFHANNELAGYASVLHALTLRGRTGAYGRRMRAVVIAYGATGRGAVAALRALGVEDVTVLLREGGTARPTPPGVEVAWLADDPAQPGRTLVRGDDVPQRPTVELLAEHDVVVNCILQDPTAPLMFVTTAELERLRPGTLVVDVSCDAGMGFEWTRPTSFAEPTYELGRGIVHYAVDHSPSYLWDAATWEISEALLPFLPTVLAGPEAWEADPTIRRAIELEGGRIRNEQILAFQGRAADWPHPRGAEPR